MPDKHAYRVPDNDWTRRAGDVLRELGRVRRLLRAHAAFEAQLEERGSHLVWTGGTGVGGYGRVRWEGRIELAHRVAWLFEHGTWPAPRGIRRTCGEPACVRHWVEVLHVEQVVQVPCHRHPVDLDRFGRCRACREEARQERRLRGWWRPGGLGASLSS
jgi:hypothetical protein